MLASGAVAAGVTRAVPLTADEAARLRSWLAEGNHGEMGYMENHFELRCDPAKLQPGAESVIALAFNYTPAQLRDASLPQIATYAYGLDYHDVLRRRLDEAVAKCRELAGGEWRICIDSAPTPDRHWAELAGIGTRCANGLIHVPTAGTRVFLAEIITSTPLEVLTDGVEQCLSGGCTQCGACHRACPSGALRPDGTLDARRCLSYLTIEKRGDWSAEGLEAMQTQQGRATLYGCDICQNVCPLNRRTTPTAIDEFAPRPGLLTLTSEAASTLTQEEFSRLFKGSPIKRTKLAGLLRNARNTLTTPDHDPP